MKRTFTGERRVQVRRHWRNDRELTAMFEARCAGASGKYVKFVRATQLWKLISAQIDGRDQKPVEQPADALIVVGQVLCFCEVADQRSTQNETDSDDIIVCHQNLSFTNSNTIRRWKPRSRLTLWTPKRIITSDDLAFSEHWNRNTSSC